MAPTPFPIRRLVPDDASAYRALMLRGYDLHPDAFTSTVAERGDLPLAWWSTRLDPTPAAREQIWGVFAGPTLAGVAGLELNHREKTRHRATVFGVFVAPEFRGRGLARLLLDAVLAGARAVPGLERLDLTVTAHNTAARHLYEQSDFHLWGTDPDAIRWQGKSWTKLHYVISLAERDSPPVSP